MQVSSRVYMKSRISLRKMSYFHDPDDVQTLNNISWCSLLHEGPPTAHTPRGSNCRPLLLCRHWVTFRPTSAHTLHPRCYCSTHLALEPHLHQHCIQQAVALFSFKDRHCSSGRFRFRRGWRGTKVEGLNTLTLRNRTHSIPFHLNPEHLAFNAIWSRASLNP